MLLPLNSVAGFAEPALPPVGRTPDVCVCVYYWGGREPKERETNMELRGAQVTTGGWCLLFVLIRQGLRGEGATPVTV